MIAKRKLRAALFALLSTTALTAWNARAQESAQNPRIALVIGNATYKDKALGTTANDAGLVAQTLQAAGFEVIGARDLDEKSLRTALRDFLDKAAAAGPDMEAFVYLSGRGLQYDGDNYFVPVDAQINRDADVPIEALRVADFTHALAATPGRARIVVLDAARANAYAGQGAPLAPGLALVDPEPGELIAYNAAPGTLAGDEQGPYGVYGKALAGAMRQGGVAIEDVFEQTRVEVNQQTQGAVIPWSASKLGAPYYVFERAADAPPPPAPAPDVANKPIASFPPADAYNVAVQRDTLQSYEEYLSAFPQADQARRVRAILAARREAAFWRRSVSANNPRAFWTYLRLYPKGPHVADARRRLAMLAARYEPPADFQPIIYDDLPPPPPDEDFYEQRPYYAFDEFGPPPPPPPVGFYYRPDDDWRDLPPPPPPREIGVLPVLGIALPLLIGAIAYRERHHRDGVAPVGFRAPPPPPREPPRLPPNIRPVRPPEPIQILGPRNGAGFVRPLPPIVEPRPGPATRPPVVETPPARLPPAGGGVGERPLGLPGPANGGRPPLGAPVGPGGRPFGVSPPAMIQQPIGGRPPLNEPPGFRVRPPVGHPPLVEPPPVMRAPPPVFRQPPPVVQQPAPVFRQPPPMIQQPPPVVRMPPPQAPVFRQPPPQQQMPVFRPPPQPMPAFRQPPPQAQPGGGVGRPPLCGRPGLPPCPR